MRKLGIWLAQESKRNEPTTTDDGDLLSSIGEELAISAEKVFKDVEAIRIIVEHIESMVWVSIGFISISAIGFLALKVIQSLDNGGVSVVNKDITQLVEVRPKNERFSRLLELLGEWCDKGKVLIFVRSPKKCDSLFKDLLKHGYSCHSFHGAKDQTDREVMISDFKGNACNILIATSRAAKGLDVKRLKLVVNFDVPKHYKDYVHHVGRTGRKGCAITFISELGARYSPHLVKALELSEQAVPGDLKALADGFMAEVKQ